MSRVSIRALRRVPSALGRTPALACLRGLPVRRRRWLSVQSRLGGRRAGAPSNRPATARTPMGVRRSIERPSLRAPYPRPSECASRPVVSSGNNRLASDRFLGKRARRGRSFPRETIASRAIVSSGAGPFLWASPPPSLLVTVPLGTVPPRSAQGTRALRAPACGVASGTPSSCIVRWGGALARPVTTRADSKLWAGGLIHTIPIPTVNAVRRIKLEQPARARRM